MADRYNPDTDEDGIADSADNTPNLSNISAASNEALVMAFFAALDAPDGIMTGGLTSGLRLRWSWF